MRGHLIVYDQHGARLGNRENQPDRGRPGGVGCRVHFLHPGRQFAAQSACKFQRIAFIALDAFPLFIRIEKDAHRHACTGFRAQYQPRLAAQMQNVVQQAQQDLPEQDAIGEYLQRGWREHQLQGDVFDFQAPGDQFQNALDDLIQVQLLHVKLKSALVFEKVCGFRSAGRDGRLEIFLPDAQAERLQRPAATVLSPPG